MKKEERKALNKFKKVLHDAPYEQLLVLSQSMLDEFKKRIQ